MQNAWAQQPAPPALTAHAWVLVDADSHQILASDHIDERVEPASLTKLMTAYLVFDALASGKFSMDQIVYPSNAIRQVHSDESRMFLVPNQPVSVHDLVYGMVIQSGNDAAIALAELVGGTQANFVTMMNEQAQKMGMTHTHYADVNGMPDPQHYTSAGDLAILSEHLVHDFPQYFPIFSIREFTYNKIKQLNRNRLLWLNPNVDGLKTGHTERAGFCLIATAKYPAPGASGVQRRLLSVVMGEPTEEGRVADSMKLLNYGYSAFDTVRVFQGKQTLMTQRIYKGTADQVNIGVKQDYFVTLPRTAIDAKAQVKTTFTLNQPLIAPLQAGQQVGVANIVTQDGSQSFSVPLVALKAVPQAGLASRLWDSALLYFVKK